ncbi:substrate-binding domain-containing protein [Comamonas humi]
MQPSFPTLPRRALLLAAAAVLAGCATQTAAPPNPALATPIRLVTSGGFAEAHQQLFPLFEKQTGGKVESAYGSSMGASTTSIPNRLQRGEPIDVVVLERGALDKLVAQGQVRPGSEVDLVRSSIGLAVRAGAPVPDISTEAKFKQVLLAAPSIAYSASASGTFYETKMLKQLGIEAQVLPKSKKVVGDRVGTIVARGDAVVGMQQVSELLPIPGITFVGRLPDSVQSYAVFSAGIATGAKNPEGARELLRFYQSAAARPVVEKTGLEVIAPKP